MGGWEPIITALEAALQSAGVLAILIGCTVRAVAGTNSETQAWAARMLAAGFGGLVVGFLAHPIYDLFFTWAPIGGG